MSLVPDRETYLSHRPYVLLPSGNIIDLANPAPTSWSDRDLALGLSRTYRWGGHSRWPLALSVAQHCLSVEAIRRFEDPCLSPELALFELLHDAEEGLTGWDCLAPLKPLLGAPFAELSARLSAAVAKRYGLPVPTPDQYRAHKHADRVAAASEALHVIGWSRKQIRDVLGITEAPQTHDPLAESYHGGFRPWQPWPAETAAARWLDRLGELQHDVRAAARWPVAGTAS